MLNQLVGIQLPGRLLIADTRIHDRLRRCRFIRLVVTMAAITNQVDDNIFLEFLPILQRQARHKQRGFRVVAIDVEDRCFDHLRDITAIVC